MYWVGQKVCSSFSATLYGKARMNFLDNPIKANKSPITTEKYLLKLLDTLILSDSYRKRNEVLVDLPNNLKTHSSILWGRNILKSGVCVCVYIHTYIRIYIYTHIHIYTYTYTHTYTHLVFYSAINIHDPFSKHDALICKLGSPGCLCIGRSMQQA